MAYSGSSGAYAPRNDPGKNAGTKTERQNVGRGAPAPAPAKKGTPFLARRAVAALIAAVLIVSSTLFSVNRTLGEKSQAVTDSFYSGVVYDGYAHSSISSQLGVCSNTANGLMSLASNYSELDALAKDVKDARDALIGTMDAAASGDADYGVSEIRDRYKELVAAVGALVSAMEDTELTDREKSGLTQYLENFKGAQGVIEKAGYNEAVREFLRSTMNVFPANYLGKIAGVEAPELFE